MTNDGTVIIPDGRSDESECLLSILCHGRTNGTDHGNFAWRLATVLNRHAENILFLGLEQQVEILVTDWGSEPPLHACLDLTENARNLVTFILVPPAVAALHDTGSGYPVPHAINAVARRARGRFVISCGPDLLVPLETMAKLMHYLKLGYFHSFNVVDSFFWASKYLVPRDCTDGLPFREHLEEHIEKNITSYWHERVATEVYSGGGVGLLMSREMWFEANGFDERLAGSDTFDDELTRRLLAKYRWDDLENHGMRFFLLDHAQESPQVSAQREKGPRQTGGSAPDPADWGLCGAELPCLDGFGLPRDNSAGAPHSGTNLFFDQKGPLRSVREIVATNPRYQEIGRRFEFEPHSFYCNAEPIQALLSVLQPETVCEVGSWMGASARSLAAYPSVKQVVCVDHWDRYRIEKYRPGVHREHMMNNMYEQFLANAVHSGSDDKICPVRLDSAAAAAYFSALRKSFHLIYVDGDHTTVGARADILRFFPLLNQGGYLCGDDWTWQKEPDNVSGAVISVAREKDMRVCFHGNFWLLTPGGFSIQPLTGEVLREIRPVARKACEAPQRAVARPRAPETAQPLVSILCTCKNAEATIRRHLLSIIEAVKQYDNIEYIFQDGVSTDATLKIVDEYKAELGDKLKLVSAPDSCCEEGYWLAMSRCQGDIIVASLSDEEILPGAIPFVVEQFLKNPGIDVIHGDIYNTDIEGNITCRNPSRDFDLVKYLSHLLPMHLAASFFRKSALVAGGLLPYPNRYGLLKDDYFTWAYLGLTANIAYFPVVFAKYAIHDNALSIRHDLVAGSISRRASFLEKFIADDSTPRELKVNRNFIMGNFYAVSANRLIEANLSAEAEKYQIALAGLMVA